MSQVNPLDALAHPLFYETIDRYEAKEDEFLAPVKELLTGDWDFARKDVWFNATPPQERSKEIRRQGWKIHVSSAVDNGLAILQAIVPVLDRQGVSFKFSLDRNVLKMMNGKNWGRQGAGKFVTIYPEDTDHFVTLLADLHEVTKAFQGLYILSDRRYRDSKVLFYRYGGIRPHSVTNERGEDVSMLVTPEGEEVPDRRGPTFYVPPWTSDPFEENAPDDPAPTVDEKITLKDGRYVVKDVFGFSNSGGVYVADDTETGEEVIIKEARPFVSFVEDATSLLRKEYRLLHLVHEAGEGISPRPIDFFQDWEHSFLVQELIQGGQLGSYSASRNVTLRTSPTLEDAESFYGEFREIFTQVARILEILHAQKIVFADLSPNNLLVMTDPLRVRIIDFEGAFEIGVDEPPLLFTPGFAYRDQILGEAPTFRSDYFSFGAVMHAFLAPFNQIFSIAPKSRFSFLASVMKDIGFPDEVHQIIVDLLGNDEDLRPKPRRVIEVLEREHTLRPPSFSAADASEFPRYQEDIEGIAAYCLSEADFSRQDRLFPAHAAVFATNPLSLAYGACGVAHALQTMGQDVPEEVIDWILQPTSDRDRYAPGLYSGLAGIAWAVFDLGRPEVAVRILNRGGHHPILESSFDLFHGLAGWGMTNLKFFLALQDEQYLDRAIAAGHRLNETAQESEKGRCWPQGGEIGLGLGHGPSGVALFLLYLYRVTGTEAFLTLGQEALDYDLACGIETRDGGLSWRRYDNDGAIIYPYWRYGSAGIASVLVRYHAVLGTERYQSFIDKIFPDLNRKYAVFPGLFVGLSGIGETLLDLQQFTGEGRFLQAAHRIATGLSLFRIPQDGGLAYPGDGLNKICCDLATGSAGVGRFFHRLIHGGAAPFLLDELLAEHVVGARARGEQPVLVS